MNLGSFGKLSIVYVVLALFLIIELGLTGYGKLLVRHTFRDFSNLCACSRGPDRRPLVGQLAFPVRLYALHHHLVDPRTHLHRRDPRRRPEPAHPTRVSRPAYAHVTLLVRWLYRHGCPHRRSRVPRQQLLPERPGRCRLWLLQLDHLHGHRRHGGDGLYAWG